METCAELAGLVLIGFASLLIGGFIAYGSLHRRLTAHEERLAALEEGAAGRSAGAEPRPEPEVPWARPAEPPPSLGKARVSADAEPAQPPPAREPAVPSPPAAGPPTPEPEAPSPSEAPSPPAAPASVDWERWIGVRGAAVLGGIVLSIAGLLFLQYTIEAGWFTPSVRVLIAFAAGLAALGVSPLQRRRGYTAVSEALAGAGVVLLYGALWAGHVLYDLFGALPAFAGLVAVTAACGWIAWRHGARIVAILGLMGGFAAPLILSAPVEDPLGLFGYLLLLNVGLWLVARRRGWDDLGLIAVVATAAYEVWWVEAWLPRHGLGGPIVVLAGFGLLWAAAGELDRRSGGARSWSAAQLLGVALPALLGFRLAAALGDGVDLWKLGAYLAVLSLAGDRVAAVRGLRAFGIALAALGVGVLAVTGGLAVGEWARIGVSVLLAAVFHLGFELDRRRGRIVAASGDPALVATLGHLALLVALATVVDAAILAPWLVGWSILAALLARQAAVSGGEWRTPAAAALVGLGLTLLFVEHRRPEVPAAALVLGGLAAVLARSRRSDPGRRAAWLAAAIVLALALLALWAEGYTPTLGPWVFLGAGLALAVLGAAAATALRSASLYALPVALLAFCHWAWTVDPSSEGRAVSPTLLLAALLVFAVVFTLWPGVATRLRPVGPAVAVGAAAATAWALPVVWTWQDAYGRAWDGVPALALAAVSGLGLAIALRRRDGEEELREAARTWFPIFGLGLVAAAVALQLEREWLTIGWAALAVSLLAGWRRLGWEVLRAWALVLFAGVAARLVLNPCVVAYHGTEGPPILNWLAWTYLLPAAALLAGRRLLSDRGGEADSRDAPAAIACGLAAVLVVFWWLNLTVVEIFSAGPGLDLSLGHRPARDLTLSGAWILYALGLLALGLARRSRALRWLSLGFLVLAILKVFLYDLGELRDLWRVASLLGLALCLLTVSLVYQRFVFGREKGGPGHRIEKSGKVAVAVPRSPVPPVTAEKVEEVRREIREERARRHEGVLPPEDV